MVINAAGPLPCAFPGDPTRWRQILINLLGNALKFTAEGEIRVDVRWRDGQPNNRRFEFEVRDSGIGMNREQLGKLFRPFAQADTSTTRKFGGTGLGLTISQRLAHLMGGEITVTSEAHCGSAFTLSLQPSRGTRIETTRYERLENALLEWQRGGESLLPDAPADESTVAYELPAGTKILLIEDGPDNRRLIEHLLKKFGAETQVAENGAIGCAKVLGGHERFDVILMDMQMPVMDGYGATATLREAGCTTPIIALTANAMSSDRRKCLEAGCNDYLTKPIDRTTLLATLRKHLAERPVARVT
ncbi:MAG: ATP-binding protein [Pirellulales bacterium]